MEGGGGAKKERVGGIHIKGGWSQEESICRVTFSDPFSLMNPNEGFNKITVYNLCLHQSVQFNSKHRSATLPISFNKHTHGPSHLQNLGEHASVAGTDLAREDASHSCGLFIRC